MVRYIAPQFDQIDDNDDGQEEATPMDWEIISDNECNDYTTTTSLVQHNEQDDDYESIEYHKAELLQMEEEEYHQAITEQQYKKKKWKRIRIAITITIVIIAIVLKRHAPPPPPIVYQSPFVNKDSLPNYSNDNSATNSINDDGTTAASYSNDLLQHETWSQYTKHILNLLHQTLRYSISVTYYTISNSFLYTFDEVYDVCVDVLSNNRSSSSSVSVSSMKSAIKSWLEIWLEKLPSLDDTSARFNKMIQRRKSRDNNQDMNDTQQQYEDEVVACPIKIPSSARVNQQHNQINQHQVIPTEDKLRQTIGVSLSPQNMALQLITDRLDTWGNESLMLQQQAPPVSQTKMGHNAELILPPAMGFLLVGSEGVGKLHIARRLSYLLLGHCSSNPRSAGSDDQDSPLAGVLQVNGSSFNYQSIMELIVFHIHSRTNLGSVVIIQHVEEMDKQVFEILKVLSGSSSTLSYKMKTNGDDKVIETSCNGTVFVMTSRLWGVNSIYQHLQLNIGRKGGLNKESLTSSIRHEVTSHFNSVQVSRSMTIVPILPFQHEDLSSILQGRIQGINIKYQGVHWKNLVVSLAAIRYHVDVDHVNFSDTYTSKHDDGEEEISMALSYSTNGAHSIINNILWQRLHPGITAVDRRRPESTLKVDIDENSKELRFSWCKIENGLETCQVE